MLEKAEAGSLAGLRKGGEVVKQDDGGPPAHDHVLGRQPFSHLLAGGKRVFVLLGGDVAEVVELNAAITSSSRLPERRTRLLQSPIGFARGRLRFERVIDLALHLDVTFQHYSQCLRPPKPSCLVSADLWRLPQFRAIPNEPYVSSPSASRCGSSRAIPTGRG